MATRANKHATAEQQYYGEFSGGLNLSLPGEGIGKNEMQIADNFEYNTKTGALKLRDGIVLMETFAQDIQDIIPVAGADALLVRLADNNVHRLDEYTLSGSLGTVLGSGKLSHTTWGDNSEVLMCAGGKLYHYNGTTLAVVSESPDRNDFCFTRAGRVGVVDSSSDTITYSGVGDIHNWQLEDIGGDTWNDADAVSIEVGYKDGCDLVAVAPLASDLVVFKRPQDQPGLGRIYRVTGNYPNWEVTQHSSGSSTWGHSTWATTTNDLIFIASEGIASLGTVTDYGDIKMQWAGAKVNPVLARELMSECRMWKMGGQAQLWVKTKPTGDIWVYSYGVGQGAWTKFKFPSPVIDACTTGTKRYIALANQVYRMDETFGTDNGQPFVGRVKMQSIRKIGMMVIKYCYVAFDSMADSEAELIIEGNRITLNFGGQLGDMVVSDTDVASEDDDYLLSSRSASVRTRMNIRVWDATAELKVTRGPFSLNAVGLEVAEV